MATPSFTAGSLGSWRESRTAGRFGRFQGLEAVATHLQQNNLLRNTRIVSLDVFDTLLFRRCSPEAVQLAVAKDIALLLGRPIEYAHHLLQERNAAYAAAAAEMATEGSDSDAHLDHIHREWAKRLAPQDVSLQARLTQRATSSKMRYEAWACYANPSARPMLTNLRNLGITLVFVSDMYLGKNNVESLLQKCDLLEFFHSGYVSGDHSALKSSGRLFGIMVADLQANPSEIIHIGDNPEADGLGAAKAGIRSCVIGGRESQLAQMRFDQRHATVNRNWHGMCASRFAEPASPQAYDYVARRIGRGQLGPVFANYVHGLVEYCARVKADSVYFLSREGLLLKSLYEELASVVEGELPPARYLCVSRLTAARASMREFGSREIERAFDAGPTSIRRILRHLDFDEAELNELVARHGFPNADVKISSANSAPLTTLVADSTIQERATSFGSQCRRELISYLRGCGFLDARCVVLADVGWAGQIPAHLEESLSDVGHPELHSYFIGADSNANRRRNSGTRIHADIWDATRHTWAGSATYKCVHIIENACRAPHGTVIGHRNGKPLIQADSADERIPELADEPGVALMQAGIHEYMAWYSRYVSMVGAQASDTVQYARTAIARLVYFPRKDELEFLGSLINVENFGRGDSTSLTSESSLMAPRSALHAIRASLWREGTMARVAGRFAGLFLSAFREWTWAKTLPSQVVAEQILCDMRFTGADQRANVFSPDLFEVSMHERSRELLRIAFQKFTRTPSIPPVTTSDAICLQGAHLLSRALVATRFRQFQSGLLSATSFAERRCIAIAYHAASKFIAIWPLTTGRTILSYARRLRSYRPPGSSRSPEES